MRRIFARRPLLSLAPSGAALGVFVALSVVLLGATLALAWSMLRQARALDENVAVTTDIINANVRTLGQVQRELLRLSVALGDPAATPQDVDLHRAFVSQRMQEATLSYQLQTLGTQDLLDSARQESAQWFSEVEPRVAAVVAGTADGAADRTALVRTIDGLEKSFNDLVTQGELNRKDQARDASNVTIDLLHAARRLLVGFAMTFVGFLLFVVLALLGYRRFRRQQEESAARLLELNAEARKLSEVASRTGNLVVVTDALGQVEWVNEAFERVTGYALDDMWGRRPGDLLQGPDTDEETARFMRRRLLRGEGFTCEVLNYTRDGRPYWVSLEVCPVHDDSGRLTNFIAVESDITEARESQELLRQAKEAAEELAEQKAQFLASMSHEIRTPLNAVIGLTDLLLESELAPADREYVQMAHNSGTLLLSTISNILSFSAADAGQVELGAHPFSVAAVTERCGALLRAESAKKGIALTVHVADDVPAVVVGDDVRLQQVLVNLVGNAVKFTEAGRVAVTVRSTPLAGDVARLEFTVADTGIGIRRDRMRRLFQPFTQVDASTTRRYGGSGLGLAISQRLVRLMGGEISVESEEHRGSRFRFTLDLPVGRAELLRPRSIDLTEDAGQPSAPLRILLAEDDAVNQMVAAHMLRRLGHEVEVAGDGLEALAKLRRRPVDVVLMDVQMPRLDGVSTVARIRREWPAEEQPYVVALTANALDGDRERFLAAGMDAYLSKPFRLEQLRSALALAVDSTNPA